MTHFDFYFDPVCPFAWAASRWLTAQADRRGDEIDWHVMSLAVLNEDQEPESAEQREKLDTARRLGRVFMAAVAKNGAETIGPLYSAVGRRFHHAGEDMNPGVVAEVLAEVGLPTSIAEAMDDESLDDELGRAHQRSQDALGETGGCPIVGVDGTHFFGPVLAELPTGEEADTLYAGLLTLAQVPSFAQIKRPAGGPPTFSS